MLDFDVGLVVALPTDAELPEVLLPLVVVADELVLLLSVALLLVVMLPDVVEVVLAEVELLELVEAELDEVPVDEPLVEAREVMVLVESIANRSEKLLRFLFVLLIISNAYCEPFVILVGTFHTKVPEFGAVAERFLISFGNCQG